jgi:YidC/Oxa1 family membrane protein insertase
MNKSTLNTILGIALIFAVFLGYMLLTKPSAEDIRKKRQEDSTTAVAQMQKKVEDIKNQITSAKADSVAKKKDTVEKKISPDSLKTVLNDGLFGTASQGQNKHITIETDKVKIQFATRGGGISSVELKDYKSYDQKPLIFFNTDTSNYSIEFFSEDDKPVKTTALFFTPFWYNQKFANQETVKISGKDSVVFAMRLYPGNDSVKSTDKYIEFLYTIRADNYMMGFNINFVNMDKVVAQNNPYLAFDWKLSLTQQEKSHKNEMLNTTVYYKPDQDDVAYLKESKDNKEEKLPNVKWVAFKQTFFTATLISGNAFTYANVENYTNPDTIFNGYLKTLSTSLTLPYTSGKDQSYPMSFYFGPTHFKTLASYKLDMERQIPLGWSSPYILGWINRWMVIPVFNVLNNTGMNYGIIILILTILLKILLLPIAYKTYMSSAKMRVLKPEVDEISQKFPKKEDALKKQQATMALYKKAGVNPMSGCIPILLQMPILIALYRFFPASIELRQQSFLWATDLSSYDSIWNFPNGFSIPFYGDHVSLFTLLMTASTIIYTYLNNQMMSATSSQPGMKFMMYAMPIMFLGFFNDFASGLSYYYLLANLITFLQMYLFRKFINEDKIHARIQENKKKPAKVSTFQKRLETMAKNRGVQTKK